MVKDHSDGKRKETCCLHYHGLCYSSHGALEWDIAQWVHHEGLIWWPIAPWADALPCSYIPLFLITSTVEISDYMYYECDTLTHDELMITSIANLSYSTRMNKHFNDPSLKIRLFSVKRRYLYTMLESISLCVGYYLVVNIVLLIFCLIYQVSLIANV